MSRTDIISRCEFVGSDEDDTDHYDNLHDLARKEGGSFKAIGGAGLDDKDDFIVYENESHYIILDCTIETLYKKP